MATGITKAQADKLTSDDPFGTYVADGQQPNLFLRVLPSGTKTWTLRRRIDGRWKSQSLGRYPKLDPAQARLKAQNTARAWGDAAVTGDVDAADMTFGQAATIWYEGEIAGGPRPFKRPKQVKAYIDRDWAPLAELKLRQVTMGRLKKLIEAKRSTSPNAANKLLAQLSKFFRHAMWADWVAVNPMEKLTFGKVGTPQIERNRKLTDDEIRAAWAIPAPHATLYRMLLATGQRVGEVLALAHEPDAIRGDVWFIFDNKSNRPHSLPMTPLMCSIVADGLKRKKGAAAHHLWRQYMPGDPKQWATQHDIRRTVATRMAELGIDPLVIEYGVLNHAVPKLMRTYQQPNRLATVRDALEKWQAELQRIVECRE